MPGTDNVIRFPQTGQHSASGDSAAARAAETGTEGRQEQGSGAPDEMSVQLTAVAERRDRHAFVALFRHFSPRVRAYLLRRSRDWSKVDDVLQDVFATVWHKANLYDGRSATASAWIFTIARNRSIDAFRRERRPEVDWEDPALQPTPALGAEETVVAQQRTESVLAALAVLSDEQREVVHLSFYEGESYAAIAVRLGIPLGTVKSRARLAFGRLRTELGQQREELR